ncbi:unnamed protein product [Chrysodeixis includens]|uniref:Uncharacterized protein n=1 Tax=Chrysodeixis includens TaxID=689277 RepID=A0A9P0BPJ5_CHRIL|nr:unnamed protein product [Chrysodeixis includens]
MIPHKYLYRVRYYRLHACVIHDDIYSAVNRCLCWLCSAWAAARAGSRRGRCGTGTVTRAAARAGLLAVAAWAAPWRWARWRRWRARRSAPLLAAAFSLLALTAVAEAAAGWWGAAHRPQLRRALLDSLDHTVRHEYGVIHTRTQLLDVIQQGLECCGAEGPRDWQHSVWARAQERAGGAGAGGRGRCGRRRQRGGGARGDDALDLSVGAAGAYYWVPESCCAAGARSAAARRVGGVGRGAGCGRGLRARAGGAGALARVRWRWRRRCWRCTRWRCRSRWRCGCARTRTPPTRLSARPNNASRKTYPHKREHYH